MFGIKVHIQDRLTDIRLGYESIGLFHQKKWAVITHIRILHDRCKTSIRKPVHFATPQSTSGPNARFGKIMVDTSKRLSKLSSGHERISNGKPCDCQWLQTITHPPSQIASRRERQTFWITLNMNSNTVQRLPNLPRWAPDGVQGGIWYNSDISQCPLRIRHRWNCLGEAN